MTFHELVDQVVSTPYQGNRRLIAIAGAPASGKSELAGRLSDAVTAAGSTSMALPMDGFHLDNRILTMRNLLSRKGASDTFDAHGFLDMVRGLKTRAEIIFPVFDRDRDIAIAGAGYIGPDTQTVIVEGNYLLFDAPIWSDLTDQWDLRIWLDVPIKTLHARLVDRWCAHGLSRDEAIARADANDLQNAKAIYGSKLDHDVIWQSC